MRFKLLESFIVKLTDRIEYLEQVEKSQLCYIEMALDNSKEDLIKRITRLESDNDQLAATNEAHLEVMLEAHKLAQKHDPAMAQKLHLTIGWAPVDLLEIRDLEQQAKALFDFEVDENIGSVACDQVTQSLKDKSYEFSNQAKALKDQGE
jgi:hypothetical protein